MVVITMLQLMHSSTDSCEKKQLKKFLINISPRLIYVYIDKDTKYTGNSRLHQHQELRYTNFAENRTQRSVEFFVPELGVSFFLFELHVSFITT